MTQVHSTRRTLLAGAAGAAASAFDTPRAAMAGTPVPGAGRALYGAAVRPDALAGNPAYAAALAERCRLIVPEGDLKWPVLRPSEREFRFEAADRIAAFAARNGLGLRGHTLAWYGGMPAWTEAITSRAQAERVLTHHIETVVSRYRGLIGSWDVVNEPTPEAPASPGELRPFVWTRTLGADYIPIAFRAAATADPAARLVLNEYDIEFVGERFAKRRAILLGIARSLVEKGVPIHAIGLQGHLPADRAIDRDGLQTFLREIRALGLDVLVTELDVVDYTLPGDIAARDARVAETARGFLSAVAEVTPPSAILTWGISDRYTWVPIYFTRRDGLPNRPLPLDADMRPKPLMAVLEHFTRTTSLTAQSRLFGPADATIVVCVPTFRRPAMLAATLDSLAAQTFSRPFAVVVVDNDAAGREGLAVAMTFLEEGRLSGTCLAEPRQGNCFAINTAFATALDAYPKAGFFLMIDDDETASPHWLERMVAASEASGAGIVGGPVMPRLESGARPGLATHPAYVPAYTTSGPVPVIFGSGNCLISRKTFERLGAPAFDVGYNFLGGGDTDFFVRARRAGIAFQWAADALITETVPLARTTTRWLAARGLRIGAVNHRIEVKHATGIGGRAAIGLKSVAVLGVSVLRGARLLVRTREPMIALHPVLVALGRCLAALGIEPKAYRAAVPK